MSVQGEALVEDRAPFNASQLPPSQGRLGLGVEGQP